MRDKQYWINWTAAAGIRVIKTMAQAAAALIGTNVFFTDVSWTAVLYGALLAGVLSALTSLAGLPEIKVGKVIKK